MLINAQQCAVNDASFLKFNTISVETQGVIFCIRISFVRQPVVIARSENRDITIVIFLLTPALPINLQVINMGYIKTNK